MNQTKSAVTKLFLKINVIKLRYNTFIIYLPSFVHSAHSAINYNDLFIRSIALSVFRTIDRPVLGDTACMIYHVYPEEVNCDSNNSVF